jgi:hypothetical protein
MDNYGNGSIHLKFVAQKRGHIFGDLRLQQRNAELYARRFYPGGAGNSGALLESPKARGKALAYVRKLLGIDNLGWYNFSETRYCLCLLSAEEIHRIICYMGGICFSEQIRKIVWGRELLKIKRTIGNDAYLFSIRSAPLMLKAGVAANFRTEGPTLIESIFNTGKTIIEMGLAGIPQEIVQRFVLKFPKNFGWNFNHRVDDPRYYFEFIKKVVKRALAESDSIAVSIIKA